MKKILLLVATAVGALAIQKQIQAKKAENRLWAEATDTPEELTFHPGCRPLASCARARCLGAMAQLVAHLLCKQGVRGSSPLGSTAGQRPFPLVGRGLFRVRTPEKYCSRCSWRAAANQTRGGQDGCMAQRLVVAWQCLAPYRRGRTTVGKSGRSRQQHQSCTPKETLEAGRLRPALFEASESGVVASRCKQAS